LVVRMSCRVTSMVDRIRDFNDRARGIHPRQVFTTLIN